MNHYKQEIAHISKKCFSNQAQLNKAIHFCRYLQANFQQQIDLHQLSRLFFTSRLHLLQTYKRYFACTPKQYLTEHRLANAKAVTRSRKTVTEAWRGSGFLHILQ